MNGSDDSEPICEKPFARLEQVTWPLHGSMAWSKLRDISVGIFETLKARTDEEFARLFAEKVTGVEPIKLLKHGEARLALQSLGVRKGGRFLHRLAQRALLTQGGRLSVVINKDGDWGAPDQGVKDVAATITVVRTQVIRFLIDPVASFS